MERIDPNGIAAALAAALDDPAALRERGRRAWADARERFSPELAALRTAEIYARVAS